MARASLIGRGRRKFVQMSLLAQSAGNNFQKHGRPFRGRWFCASGWKKKTKNRTRDQARFEDCRGMKKKKEKGEKKGEIGGMSMAGK